MAKSKRRSIILVFFLFLLPAFSMIAGYASYFRAINKTPDCIDCNIASGTSKDAIMNILSKIDSYRKAMAGTTNSLSEFGNEGIPPYRELNDLDIAFLNEKLRGLSSNRFSRDVFLRQRYENKTSEDVSPPSDVPFTVTMDNIQQISKEINEFVYGKRKLTAKPNITIAMQRASSGSNIVDGIKSNASPTGSAPSLGSPGPELIVANNLNPNDLIIDEQDDNTPVDVQPVPLSPSQYFMLMGFALYYMLKRNNMKA